METIYFFKKLTETEEKLASEYTEKKLPRIEKLISDLPPDGALLHVTCAKFEKHLAYDVELVLSLPSEKLVAKQEGKAIPEAIDLAVDHLIAQVKKSKGE